MATINLPESFRDLLQKNQKINDIKLNPKTN